VNRERRRVRAQDSYPFDLHGAAHPAHARHLGGILTVRRQSFCNLAVGAVERLTFLNGPLSFPRRQAPSQDAQPVNRELSACGAPPHPGAGG
jgi:hypothetical protein